MYVYYTAAADDRRPRRGSVNAGSTPLPKLPSLESLSTSTVNTICPPPSSPGNFISDRKINIFFLFYI